MATTNAAINQVNNGLKKLNIAANAQANANMGRNVSQNLMRMNQAQTTAANQFNAAAEKLVKINLPVIAAKLKNAARAAEAAATAKAVQNATGALNMMRSAMVKNLNLVNQGKLPATAAGVV
jgi:hypothetical protein